MKNIKLIGLLAASMTAFALALPARSADPAAATLCADGTTSTATGKGACSSHGGVQKASKTTAAPAAPAATAPAAPTPAAAPATPASGAVKTCTDGTTSTATGKGACSGHGGVLKGSQSKSAAASTAAPTTATPTVAAGSSDPAGATAKCKDGSYSKSQHRSGTCSSHGGVAEWLTAQ
jgi:uncharacterized protein DUF3761